MKIGFLISDITLNRGGERSTTVLTNALAQHTKVSIFSLYQENANTFFVSDNRVEKVFLNTQPRSNNIGKKIILKVREFIGLSKLIKNSDVDLWIGVGTYCSILLGAFKLLNRKNKYVAWEHSNYEAASTKWKMLRSIFFKSLNAIVCLTDADHSHYQKISNSIEIIPNMLPFEVPVVAQRKSKKIISIGALEEEKGFDLLIEAFSIISHQTDWNLKIIGAGTLHKDLCALISNKKLGDRIEIAAPTQDIIPQYLSAAIYVLPSRREGFSMVLLEASECGLPCIAFDCPSGPRHIINDGENGLLVPAENVLQLAQAMNLLITDQHIANQLATAGKVNMQNYHPQKILTLWYSLFNRLANENRD